MADVSAGSVSYQFKADISAFKSGVQQMQNDMRAASQSVSDSASKMGKGFNDLGKNIKATNDNLKLTGHQALQLQYQLNDVAASLGSGASPFTVLMQQGTQITQIFGGVGNTFRALGSTIAASLNPATIAIGAIVVAVGGAIIITKKWSNEFQELELASKKTSLAIEDLLRMQQIADGGFKSFDVTKGM